MEALRSLGIRTAFDRREDEVGGFPVVLTLPDGACLALDLPSPALVGALDPCQVGAAVLDHMGYSRQVWGLAQQVPFFHRGVCIFETEIARLFEGAYRGTPGALYYEGLRFFASGVAHGNSFDVFVLVMDAREEQAARLEASRSTRDAQTLKKVGKALSTNHLVRQLCISAAHSIAQSAELAAVLLWARSEVSKPLELAASVGANRAGMHTMAVLDPRDGMTCVAELAANRLQPLRLRHVSDSVMAQDLEGKFCYLRPGGLVALPLMIAGNLMGVLELIGREGDPLFDEQLSLFETIAEHLSLALNSAILYESVERQASYDPLTGVANHRAMQEFLQRRCSESHRSGQSLGVIMIDVDHFRAFNEEEGHDAGDKVLKMVADVLKSVVRPYDMAARYGGEEFTVVMPGVGLDGTRQVAERIRTQIEALAYMAPSGRVRRVSASLGCSAYPETALEPAHLLKAADLSLFEAKRSGRNRTVVFHGAYEADVAAFDRSNLKEIIRKHLAPEEVVTAESFAGRAQPYLEHISLQCGLSKSQLALLEAASLLTPTTLTRLTAGDDKGLSKTLGHAELRPVAPSLMALTERFDGKGKQGLVGDRIPLLSRVLAVVAALLLEGGRPFAEDPGRFDPEIVGLVGDVDHAA